MNEREDYLDKLLRGVEDESEIKEDDDFFSDFGSSVSDDEEDDFLKAFENSRSASKGKSPSPNGDDLDFDLDDIDNIVSNIKNGTLDDLDAAGSLDDSGDLSIEESLKSFEEDDFGLNDVGAGYAELDAKDESESDFEVNTLDEGEDTDYGTGEANQELLDMLSGIGEDSTANEESLDSFSSESDDNFSDEDFVNNLGEDFKEDLGADSGDSDMESLARQLEDLGLQNMDVPSDAAEQEEDVSPEEPKEKKEKKSKKGKKNKKSKGNEAKDKKEQGFFGRMGTLLFGEDDKVIDASDPESLSEEDKADLKKIEDDEAAKEKQKKEKAEQKEEQKEQKKKEKEEKKALKSKEKEEKKAKKDKEKAEKAQKKKDMKVVERSKPLPKGPVVLIMLVGISLVILINLLSSQVGYMISISQAQEYYDHGDYVKAYSCFTQGEKVKEVDEELFNKTRLTAYLQQQLNSYRVYKKQKMYAEALSSLIVGVGRYDKNANEAAASGAAVEYDKMLASVEKSLKKEYSMTLDEARELYGIRDKEEFTLEIYKIIDSLGLSTEE